MASIDRGKSVSGTEHASDPMQTLMGTALGFIPATALNCVSRLGIADLLKDGPRPTAELARASGTNADALTRTLRLLASIGIFTEPSSGRFALNENAELLRSDHPRSLRDMISFIADRFNFIVAAELEHSVRTG